MFVDAQKMATEHPGTFAVPSPDALAALAPGDIVKVCAGDERFWVKLTTVDGDTLHGTVDSMTFRNHGLLLGDSVEFESRHIYSIFS